MTIIHSKPLVQEVPKIGNDENLNEVVDKGSDTNKSKTDMNFFKKMAKKVFLKNNLQEILEDVADSSDSPDTVGGQEETITTIPTSDLLESIVNDPTIVNSHISEHPEEKSKEIQIIPEKKIEQPKSKPMLKKVEEKVSEITNWNDDEAVKFWVFKFVNKSERAVFLAFIFPPIIISIISMIHVVSFFELSNTPALSWLLASAFEFASISALMALTALSKIKKNTIWILFFAILTLQVIGNMYHSYIHLDVNNPDLIKLLSILGATNEELPWTLRILGFLQGGILPIVSLSFVKAIVEYLGINRKKLTIS